MKPICGVINVYKESGYTSHDVVAVLRKTLGVKKIGHAGTLDPDAQGVLIACVGKATKIASLLTADDKSYRASVKLGVTTSTLDLSGEILSETPVDIPYSDIEAAVLSFKGEYSQTPPMHSAIKQNGQKLYNLARKGVSVERKPRNITIRDIKIVEVISADTFTMDVTCSKGAYIRSLCDDIGQKLGCGACMAALIRTRAGRFDVSDALTLGQIKELWGLGEIEKAIIPIDHALSDICVKISVTEDGVKRLLNGAPVSRTHISACPRDDKPFFLIYRPDGALTAICRRENDVFKPLVTL
ncbi:MAG: tRNA pseudouridine(55) synthase TruB [Clostridiales bacterium]|jgi:tRNA pseudouridine55 synthase|nr:tRNA pseudouridine(55) synthase TruB [Clostridiales bacterium]